MLSSSSLLAGRARRRSSSAAIRASPTATSRCSTRSRSRRTSPGASVDEVNRLRLPFRPTEQLPTARDRYALGARFAHRFSGATLRVEQRLYNDSWALKATTTDGRYVFDLGRHLSLWPHVRFNAQTGANFYQLAYSATLDPNTGQLVVPLYRIDGSRAVAAR